LRGLNNYDCPLWAKKYNKGSFDKAGYAIDHIIEHSLTQDNSIENLQALCRSCHTVKTGNFNKKMSKTRKHNIIIKNNKEILNENFNHSKGNDDNKNLEDYKDFNSGDSENSEDSEDFDNLNKRQNNNDLKEEYNDIKNIIVDKIDNNFSAGKYGLFDVIIMNKNNYINATNLCNTTGKEFRFWKKNASTWEFINKISKIVGIKEDELIITVNKNCRQSFKGTYVHPRLIPDIIYWTNIEFKVYVSNIITKHINEEILNN
jgi:hypothetical protein